MSLRINHNIDAMVGQKNLSANSSALSKSLQRLSSGLRINSAADNPAGLVISEQMRAQITGLNQAMSNTQNAVSMVQTTEGALDEVNSLLNKARQLTLDAANTGVNDTNQLSADQSELDNVIASITRISVVTQFGTKNLLNGSLNGATVATSAPISHVRVGNLANNSAISAGTVSVAVTAATKESVLLINNANTQNSGAFSAAITGTNIGAATVLSGVAVTLSIDSGSSVSYTVTGGGVTASGLATKLTEKLTSGSLAFTVTETGGQLKVSRNAIGANAFTSSIAFVGQATPGNTGNAESITSTLTVSGGVSATAATRFFGAGTLSGVTAANSVTTGVVVSYSLSTATGGAYAGTYTVTGGQTLANVMTGLQTLVQAHGNGFSGAVVSMGTGAAPVSGLNIKLAKGDTTTATDFNFALTLDYNNVAAAQSEVHHIDMLTAAFDSTGADANFYESGAVAGVTGAMLPATTLAPNSAMELTVNGKTVVVTGGAAVTLTAAAASFQTLIRAQGGGLSGVSVTYLSGASTTSGLAGYVGTSGTTVNDGFVIYDQSGLDLTVSLKVDQQNGLNVSVAGVQDKQAGLTLTTMDLTTSNQVKIDNDAFVADIAASGIASAITGSTVSAGTNSSATMTTANGVSIGLKNSFTSSDGTVQMSLTTGSQDAGYKSFSLEMTSAMSLAGGSTSFVLTNGANFQIGANAGQTVGLTIDAASSTDLGRNTSASLVSLEDMSSTKKGALINGLTTEALAVIDAAINQVTNLRGTLGAFQANTLQSGLNSLQVSTQNLTAAESTIRDVDFAMESASFTRNQILVQASTSMLAQANQLPQSVLKLLG